MYAIFNKEGTPVLASDTPKSEERGGLILQDGKIRVGYPGDFPSHGSIEAYDSFDPVKLNSAQMEYFFVLDSNSAAEDLQALGSMRGPAGKNYRNAQEFSSAIVSFYGENIVRTFAISSFRDINPETGQFEPQLMNDYTIPQLTSLARDFAGKNLANVNRFIIAFADPGPNQSLVSSQQNSNQELIDASLGAFRTRSIPEETYETSVFHREFGGNASSSSTFRPMTANKPAYLVVGN